MSGTPERVKVGFTMDFRNVANRPWREYWEDCLWLMREAEALGFDYVMTQEHFFTADGYAPSVPIFLALLAERTRRVRIGSYIYILPLHHAALLAQETAVLDHLSEGRLDVTVGSGHRALEYRALGYSEKTRPSRMEEGLTVLKQAWTRSPLTFHGKYHHLDNLVIQPRPLQQPHPPLWVAATTPKAAARAGRFGTSLHGASFGAEFYNAYFGGLAEAGVSRDEVRISNPMSITVTDEDPAVVWARNKSLYFDRWDFYRKIRTEMGDPDLAYTEEPQPEAYRDFELIGDPDLVLESLRRMFAASPLTDLVHSGPAGGIDLRGEAYASLRLFAEKVLPEVQSWPAIRPWPGAESAG
ncbi:MAG TPA: LLM class flavin-dependent oxidoreductase [Steroidobacteraceae bacterium]|nr:LLM class flavin-dependent oxidoreductase [Steroidobacteraceae bacterium]